MKVRREAAASVAARQGEATTYRIALKMESGVSHGPVAGNHGNALGEQVALTANALGLVSGRI
jgi:hypothetical protein